MKTAQYIDGKFAGYVDVEDIPNETPAEQLPTSNILTKYQFMSRFTIAERLSIFDLESTNSMVKMWFEMFKIASEIDVTNAETVAGVNMLVSTGVITSERVSEILHPIQD